MNHKGLLNPSLDVGNVGRGSLTGHKLQVMVSSFSWSLNIFETLKCLRNLKIMVFFSRKQPAHQAKLIFTNSMAFYSWDKKWVFPKIGVYTPKWMVIIMENPMNKWMIWFGGVKTPKHPNQGSASSKTTTVVVKGSHGDPMATLEVCYATCKGFHDKPVHDQPVHYYQTGIYRMYNL